MTCARAPQRLHGVVSNVAPKKMQLLLACGRVVRVVETAGSTCLCKKGDSNTRPCERRSTNEGAGAGDEVAPKKRLRVTERGVAFELDVGQAKRCLVFILRISPR